MTKLDLLFTYTLAQRRDSWIQMGQAESVNTQKSFTNGTFLRVVEPGVPLNGAVIYVNEDFTDTGFSWNNYYVSNLATGTIQSANIISPYLYIILTQAQFQSITDPFNPAWIPFTELENQNDITSTITITTDELNMIFSEAGVPFIKFEELEFTQEEFLDNVVRPCLYEYYKWFPIITIGKYPMTTQGFEIPFPDPVGAHTTFGVHRAYVNPGYPISMDKGNPISRYFDEVILSTSSQGSFANPAINWKKKQGYANTGSFSTFIMERAVRQGVINYGARTRVRTDIQNGKVIGYANKMGLLEIEWATLSTDWDDIPFNRRSEARELATAKVLRTLAMLRSQVKTTDMGTIDYSGFLARADKLEEKVIALWQAASKVIIIRGN